MWLHILTWTHIFTINLQSQSHVICIDYYLEFASILAESRHGGDIVGGGWHHNDSTGPFFDAELWGLSAIHNLMRYGGVKCHCRESWPSGEAHQQISACGCHRHPLALCMQSSSGVTWLQRRVGGVATASVSWPHLHAFKWCRPRMGAAGREGLKKGSLS